MTVYNMTDKTEISVDQLSFFQAKVFVDWLYWGTRIDETTGSILHYASSGDIYWKIESFAQTAFLADESGLQVSESFRIYDILVKMDQFIKDGEAISIWQGYDLLGDVVGISATDPNLFTLDNS